MHDEIINCGSLLINIVSPTDYSIPAKDEHSRHSSNPSKDEHSCKLETTNEIAKTTVSAADEVNLPQNSESENRIHVSALTHAIPIILDMYIL